MTQSNILNAADYADALLTAKRAKNILFPILLVMILIQLAIFFVARYTTILNSPVDAKARNWTGILEYLTGLIDFLGIVFALLLAAVLCLILKVLLLGRLLGVARLTSAVIWSFVLALLLFPWQAFLNNPTLAGSDAVSNSIGLKLVGVLYTWAEFTHPTLGAHFNGTGNFSFLFLRWFRFVAAPVIAILILLAIQAKSSRGLRQALGNDVILPTTLPPMQSDFMREERGQIPGPLVVFEPVTLWGSVGGDVTVVEGGKFYMRGSIYGNLNVEYGGRVHIYGNIAGSLKVARGAKVIHSGVIAGDATNEGGRLFIDATASIQGKIKALKGETKTEPKPIIPGARRRDNGNE